METIGRNTRMFLRTWDEVSNEQIMDMVKTYGVPVTVLPNEKLLGKLAKLGAATLEILESRKYSTIYRIRETGEEVTITATKPPENSVIEEYPARPIVHIIDAESKKIKRIKPPQFEATFSTVNGYCTLNEVKWIDPQPDAKTTSQNYKKAIHFLIQKTNLV